MISFSGRHFSAIVLFRAEKPSSINMAMVFMMFLSLVDQQPLVLAAQDEKEGGGGRRSSSVV